MQLGLGPCGLAVAMSFLLAGCAAVDNVLQLLALENAAKNLPVPGVISILAP